MSELRKEWKDGVEDEVARWTEPDDRNWLRTALRDFALRLQELADKERREAVRLLAALHDECSIDKYGHILKVGPMMEPTEKAVLDARKFLNEQEGKT